MVMARVMGLNSEKIGKMFSVKKETVTRELRLAEKDGTLEELNTRIVEELVPEALEVMLYKMREEKDAFVAKEILRHLERLTNRKDEKEKSKSGQVSVQAYMQTKQQIAPGQTLTIEQRIEGEAAKQVLEEGRLEPARKENMDFIDAIVVEKVDE